MNAEERRDAIIQELKSKNNWKPDIVRIATRAGVGENTVRRALERLNNAQKIQFNIEVKND